jgi:hypothetical protein
MWRENDAGDFYWPLHPERQQDHLRVWARQLQIVRDGKVAVRSEPEWLGALVLDGEYLDPTRVGPCETADEAKRAVFARASFYLGVVAGSVAGQLQIPGSFSLFDGSLVKLAALLSSPAGDDAVKDTPRAQAWLKEIRGYLP